MVHPNIELQVEIVKDKVFDKILIYTVLSSQQVEPPPQTKVYKLYETCALSQLVAFVYVVCCDCD